MPLIRCLLIALVVPLAACGKQLRFEDIPPDPFDAGPACDGLKPPPYPYTVAIAGRPRSFQVDWIRWERRVPLLGDCAEVLPTSATVELIAPSASRVDASVELEGSGPATVTFTSDEPGLHSFDVRFDPAELGTTSGRAYVAAETAGTFLASLPSDCRTRVDELGPGAFVCDGRLYVDGGFALDFAPGFADDYVAAEGVVWQISRPDVNAPVVVRRFELDGGSVQQVPSASLTTPLADARAASRDALFLLYEGSLVRVSPSGGGFVERSLAMPPDRPSWATLSLGEGGLVSAVGLPPWENSRVCLVRLDGGTWSGAAPDCELLPGVPRGGTGGVVFLSRNLGEREWLLRINLASDGASRTLSDAELSFLVGGGEASTWPAASFARERFLLLPRGEGQPLLFDGVIFDGGSGFGTPSLYWNTRGARTDVYRR